MVKITDIAYRTTHAVIANGDYSVCRVKNFEYTSAGTLRNVILTKVINGAKTKEFDTTDFTVSGDTFSDAYSIFWIQVGDRFETNDTKNRKLLLEVRNFGNLESAKSCEVKLQIVSIDGKTTNGKFVWLGVDKIKEAEILF